MGKIMLRRTDRKCALCKHWNGAMGSQTIQPKLGGYFQVEMTEKQACYQKTCQTTANFSCSKFESRY